MKCYNYNIYKINKTIFFRYFIASKGLLHLQKKKAVFRKYWHHHAFAKDLEKAIAEKDLDRSFKVNKINVVLDASLGIKHDFFLDLAKTFSVPESSISILVFESENNAVQDYANFFKKNDITFFGKFKNELSAFCS